MKIVPDGWRRGFRIWHRPPLHDVDVELQFHFEERIAELVDRGVPVGVARAQAAAEFGDLPAVRVDLAAIDTRIARRRGLVERWEWVWQDLGYVRRTLVRSPGLVIGVVLTLTLGIGVNTAVLSVLDRLFLEPPPGVMHPNQIHRVFRVYRDATAGQSPVANNQRGDYSVFSRNDLRDIAATAAAETTVGGYATERIDAGTTPGGTRVVTTFVWSDYFAVLGVRTTQGRLFSADELRLGSPHAVVVIGNAYRHDHFGDRADAIGQVITLGKQRFTVIGVVGGAFHGADSDASDLWLPANTRRWFPSIGAPDDSGTAWIHLLIRAPTGAAAMRISEQMSTVFRNDDDSTAVAALRPFVGLDDASNDSRGASIAERLGGVALLMLLIACANVANLLLARAVSRRREIAVRLALGISRGRLVATLLTESLVISGIGGVLAIVLAYPMAAALRGALLPYVHWTDSPVNLHVLAAAALLTVVAGVVTGLAPALHASNPDLATALRTGALSGRNRPSRLRGIFIVVQAALTVLLVTAAGLVIQSLRRIATENIGYDTDRIVFASVHVDPDRADLTALVRQRLPLIGAALRGMPGIEQVGLTTNAPLRSSWAATLFLPGHDSLVTGVSFVSPDYLSTIGVHVIAGRGLLPFDRAGVVSSVLVNSALASRLWPGRSPIGQCVIQRDAAQACSRVVGVVANAHEMGIDEAATGRFYAPIADTGRRAPQVIAVRATPGRVATAMGTVRDELEREVGSWATPEVYRMEESKARELRPWRVAAVLFSAAGLLALMVALVGVYSTVAFAVGQRTHELGIRLALGAERTAIARLVIGGSMRLVVTGAVVGAVLALLAGRMVESLLYHTTAHDPAILLLAMAAVCTVAGLASSVPAWRATRVDPVIALRVE